MADDPPIHGDDYVLDMEAPSQATRETEEIGYTPVTCGPDDFARSGYTLRDYGGDTELFIAITMCDENEALFSRTTNTYVSKSHGCVRTSPNPKPQCYEERWSPLQSQRIRDVGQRWLEESRPLYHF